MDVSGQLAAMPVYATNFLNTVRFSPLMIKSLVGRSLLTVKLVDFAYKKSQVLIYTN